MPTLPSFIACAESSGPLGRYELGTLNPLDNLLLKYFKSSMSPKFCPPGNTSTDDPLPSAVVGKK